MRDAPGGKSDLRDPRAALPGEHDASDDDRIIRQELTMFLRSSAFSDGSEIPKKYTHDGQDVSPPLEWDDVPEAAKSLALIVEDPDAPAGVWSHWVVTDLPPDSKGLPEGVKDLPKGHMGINDWERAGWGGPAPPSGRHRYLFKLYALDRELGLEKPTKFELDRVLGNAVVLAEATLVGTYEKQRAA
jgi:Raf kinase inhibitor-like YbhB/YbcL family protein